MSWTKTEAEFDAFAETYAWMFGPDKTKDPLTAGCKAAIDRLQPHSILDCACGPGWASVFLKKSGFSVRGSDISARMVRLARANALKAGLRIPLTVAAWHELPYKMRRRFDFVMCHGNAIGHCRGERSMVQSLKAIRKVTHDGGHLYLDTRSWEWFRAKCARFWPGKSRDDADGHHTVISCATIPHKWSEPHIIEVVHAVEKDERMKVESHRVTFYAFKIAELFSRLRKAGFDHIDTDYRKGSAQYWIVAQAR